MESISMASEAQIRFATSLMRQLGAEESELSALDWSNVSKSQASDMISVMKQKVEEQKASAPDVPEGIHFFDGVVYKVQVAHHGSGQKYAKRLKAENASWEYAGKAPLYNLSEGTLMTLEDAKEFGRLYGVCVKCGAVLTNEESIKAGIGPICAQSF